MSILSFILCVPLRYISLVVNPVSECEPFRVESLWFDCCCYNRIGKIAPGRFCSWKQIVTLLDSVIPVLASIVCVSYRIVVVVVVSVSATWSPWMMPVVSKTPEEWSSSSWFMPRLLLFGELFTAEWVSWFRIVVLCVCVFQNLWYKTICTMLVSFAMAVQVLLATFVPVIPVQHFRKVGIVSNTFLRVLPILSLVGCDQNDFFLIGAIPKIPKNYRDHQSARSRVVAFLRR